MRWQVDWGDRIEFLRTLAERTGIEPPALAGRPELFDDLHPVVDAFAVLSAGRTLSLGPAGAVPNPISLAEIETYCRVFGIADQVELCRLIRAMDAAYLQRVRDRRVADTATTADPRSGADHAD